VSCLIGLGHARRADDSGPTVERGLTALDSLYELRNVIPGLLASSDLDPQAGASSSLHRFSSRREADEQAGTLFGSHLCWSSRNNASTRTARSAREQSSIFSDSFSPRSFSTIRQLLSPLRRPREASQHQHPASCRLYCQSCSTGYSSRCWKSCSSRKCTSATLEDSARPASARLRCCVRCSCSTLFGSWIPMRHRRRRTTPRRRQGRTLR